MNSSMKKTTAGAGAALVVSTALDIGGIGIVGGGMAFGIPAIGVVSLALTIAAGMIAYACADDDKPESNTDF